jgi:hypothetical protein
VLDHLTDFEALELASFGASAETPPAVVSETLARSRSGSAPRGARADEA